MKYLLKKEQKIKYLLVKFFDSEYASTCEIWHDTAGLVLAGATSCIALTS